MGQVTVVSECMKRNSDAESLFIGLAKRPNFFSPPLSLSLSLVRRKSLKI
jgi:hypothetical protein